MTGHRNRTHALLSASGAHRWLACPPSARLEEGFPEKISEAAEEGTTAHELAEAKLRNYFFSVDFGRQKLAARVRQLKKKENWQEDMNGYTDEYLDYVKSAALSFENAPSVAVEKRVDLSGYIPDGFGTADCILIGGGVIHVIDFKYGKSPNGKVDAKENPQMMLYALGAYEAYKMLYPVKRVKMTIVQPRLPDGISEWECDLFTLLAFGGYVKNQAVLAIEGEGAFAPDDKTCRYCRAKGACRARAEENVRLAFTPDFGKEPALLTNEEMGRYLKQGCGVASWLSDIKEAVLSECLAGREVPGWKAVEGRGSRDWTDMDAAFRVLAESGISEAVLWERKPLSLPQVEKVLGKKAFGEAVGDYVRKVPGKPALVEESDKRESVTNRVTAAEVFKEET